MAKKKRSADPAVANDQIDVETSKSANTRSNVLEKAAELFIEQGVAGSNLQDIAEAAGLTRTALYYYYRSKEEVLEAIIDQSTESVAQAIARAAKEYDCPTDQLKSAIDTFVTWVNTNRASFLVSERNENNLPREIAARHEKAKQTIFRTVQKTISDGISAGVFRQVDPAVTSFSLIGMCTWSAWWFKADGPYSLAEVATEISELALATVLALPKDFKSDRAMTQSIALIEKGLATLKDKAE